MDWFLGVIAGIISNLIYAWFFNKKSDIQQIHIFHYFYSPEQETHDFDATIKNDKRSNNRRNIKVVFEYVSTLSLTYCALFAPPLICEAMMNKVFYLDDAVYFLPHIKVDIHQYGLLAIAFMLHPIVLVFCNITSYFIIKPIINFFFEITPNLERKIRITIFLIFATLIATVSTSLYLNKPFYEAFWIVAVVLLFSIALGSKK